jgi:hypothetical protein
MKALKIFAIALIVALLACGLFACTEPTGNNKPQALSVARTALSTYLANTSSDQYGVVLEDGTVLVVESENKWHSFTFLDGNLTEGDIFNTEPVAPNGLTLETDERNLELIPANVSIYVTQTMVVKLIAKSALTDAENAFSAYLENTSAGDTDVTVEPGTVFVAEKQGKWYSYSYDGNTMVVGEVTDTAPAAPNGLVLETDETALKDVPKNVSIYITAP